MNTSNTNKITSEEVDSIGFRTQIFEQGEENQELEDLAQYTRRKQASIPRRKESIMDCDIERLQISHLLIHPYSS
jgi:hypothetical protein